MPKTQSEPELLARIEALELELATLRKATSTVDRGVALYQALVEQMQSEVHIWQLVRNTDGAIRTWRLTYANPAALEAWGLEAQDVVGKATDDIFPGSNASEVFRPIVEGIFTDGKARLWEQQFEGTGQILQMISIPVDDYFISTGIDVTELRQLEESRRQGEKLEAIGQLAGGVAHDFNNQLTGIMGYAELLGRQLDNPAQLEAVRAIETAAHRSADLTRQLLAFARRGPADHQPVAVEEILDETLSLLRAAVDRSIEIKTEITSPATRVLGDRTLLESALLNIALNARDAMPQGGLLAVRGEAVELNPQQPACRALSLEAGRYYRIDVADSGPGIKGSDIARIFEPFFTTKKAGHGMGLAGAHGTVKRHGGAIAVDSKPGAGACFSIYLPATDQAGETTTASSATEQLQPVALRIMAIDDEPSICRLYDAYLGSHGHALATFTSPRKAIEYYRGAWADLDLIILDLSMPEMDGVTLFSAMREINPEVRALLATGYGASGGPEALSDAGFRFRLQKPFREADLIAAVGEATRA